MRRLQAARERLLDEDAAAASVPAPDPPQSVDAAMAPDGAGAVEADAGSDAGDLWVPCYSKKCEEWRIVP